MQYKMPGQEKLAMLAGETIFTRTQPWLRTNIRDKLRVITPSFVFVLCLWLASIEMQAVALYGMIAYAVINLSLLAGLRHRQVRSHPILPTALLMLLALSDALLALLLLFTIGPLNLAIFPLYAVMAMKAFHYRRRFLWMLLVPTLRGPVYLLTLYLQAQYPQGPQFEQLLAYWGLVAGSFVFVSLLLVMSEYRLHENRRLVQDIESMRKEYDSRVTELESINTDLRVRIRAQQALEESLRAITNSLALDDVLRQILDSMMQMLGTARVSAAALTLKVDGGAFTHRTLSLEGVMPDDWAEPLARRVVAQRSALLVGDAIQEREWRELCRYGVASALSVPLIDSNDVVRGALTVASVQRQAFTSTEARHMNSFSLQASMAIHNAELHSQLAQQRVMLDAVLRDIGDGLLVLDEHGSLVLANTVAYQALAHDDAVKAGLQERLIHLAADVRADGQRMLTREIQIGAEGEGNSHVYQAFASIVRISEHDPRYVAVVLHDVTDNKAEERARVEFISMVSHELRNPLNTLNGFLKVVLQGRAGGLSDLQREFLELADSQAEQLKGRITELLEFNRLEAGRLRIQPDWCDLSTLITTTGTRLQLQAEQAGLNLSWSTPAKMPEVLMDSERIGQVLTNLVENAIKATPPGGSIAIGSELCDTEVRVYVRDSGVGIPAEEQSKIFGRFYRFHQKATHHGAHLGLGLSICQQIVESHNGRIWVESEVGKGSLFIFTLPLVDRERVLGGRGE